MWRLLNTYWCYFALLRRLLDACNIYCECLIFLRSKLNITSLMFLWSMLDAWGGIRELCRLLNTGWTKWRLTKFSFDRFSILYSVFVLIFWIACKLLPKSLDTAWLTSLTFFDFKSRIVSANKRNSGSLHKMFLVFSLSFSLYKEGWTLERCTHNPDSKPVENLEWWHLNNRLCSSGGSLVQ